MNLARRPRVCAPKKGYLKMKFTKLFASILLATAAAATPAIAAGAPAAQPADFQTQADTILQAAYPADGPGAAVIVTRGGKVIYTAGRGFADVEARRPITPETVFRLGSIAKQFTAALVLKLVAEQKISLDDPISRFFPDWPEPGARATVRQLLNHTSGIQDFSKIPGWIGKHRHQDFTTAELLAVMRNLPARAEPGHAWEYNNGGYVMLGAIIEKATAKAWHEALAERITRPLGLRTIAYASGGRPAASARGYTDKDGRQQPVQLSNMSVAHAAGGLMGSVSDMARWAQALHGGRVASPALYQEMIRPARLADGSTRPYGFGLRLQRLRGRTALVHGGAGGGLDTDSVYLPSEDLFVAVFANSDNPPTDPSILTRRFAALAIGKAIPTFARADVALPTIEPLFGAYRSPRDAALRFFTRDGRLYLASGDNEMEAFPAGGDRFFFGPDRLVWIRFLRRPDGAHVLEVHEPDAAQPERAVRTGPVPPPLTIAPAVLQSYVGTYQTETLAVTIALGENGWLTITPAGQRPLPMRPVSETEFRIDSGNMRLVFHPENGEVNRFTMYRGARELHGKRTGR
jgi:CubicO group peptidase (beta-lactamase class C family)